MTNSLEEVQQQIAKLQETLTALQKADASGTGATDDAATDDAATDDAGTAAEPQTSPATTKSARRRERRRRAALAAQTGEQAPDEQAPAEVTPAEAAATAAAADADTVDVSDPADAEETAAATDTDADTDAEPHPSRLTRAGRTIAGAVPSSRRGRIVVAAVAAVVVAAAITVPLLVVGSDSGLPKNVAFRLAGRNVTTDQLDAEAKTLGALYGIKAPTAAKDLDTFRRDTAKAYAVSLIIQNAAASKGIVIADKSAQDVLTKYIAQQFGDGSDAYDNFVQALGTVGTTAAAVTDEIKRQLALSQLFDKITAGASVSDAELTAGFTKDKASLASPEKRTLNNIVVATQAQATAALKAIAGGVPFATEASKVSLDASTKAKGGSLGAVTSSQLDDAYAKVAFAAKAGQLFGPVQSQYGWNIGQVVSVTPAQPAVFASVKSTLKQQLLLQKELSQWRTWLGNQIKSAHVQYASDYRPESPNSAPSGTPAQIDSPSGSSTGSTTSQPTK